MIWLMLRGELPSRAQANLLEAALVPGVDHGPQAPSIAIARMAVTCGLPVNGAMASAINVSTMSMAARASSAWSSTARSTRKRAPTATSCRRRLSLSVRHREAGEKIVPGFGHRFHPVDPRTKPLVRTGRKGDDRGCRHRTLRRDRPRGRNGACGAQKRHIPMNIDGITAVVFSELGFEPELGRGSLPSCPRAVGILAHAWEQKQEAGA